MRLILGLKYFVSTITCKIIICEINPYKVSMIHFCIMLEHKFDMLGHKFLLYQKLDINLSKSVSLPIEILWLK